MLFTLAQTIVLSAGWRRRGVAALAGACGGLAMAPVNAWPALVIPMTAAVWLIDGSAHAEPGGGLSGRAVWASVRAAAGAGWCWGFGYFVANLWWLGSAFLAEPEKFAWALPFGVFGLPAYLALFPALGFAAARLLWGGGWGRLFTLAACLTGAEWLRGTVLTGFPWGEYGMALGGTLVLGQAASLVGEHGLTVLAVLFAAAPATLCDPRGPPGRGWSWRRGAPALAASAGLAALAAFGLLRLSGGTDAAVPGVRLRIVQPNAAVDADFSYARRNDILNHYLVLSDRATSPTTSGLADVTHLIWPESPFPFILSREADLLASLGAALPTRTTLVTGAARRDDGERDASGRSRPLFFNAVQVVASGGTILDSYDKVHLVPFGEYVPWERLLRRLGVQNFVSLPGGFEAGRTRRLLDVPGLPPVAAVVCYEAIFSGEVVPRDARGRRRRPGLLLNVTDDGWFGVTPGPYQHFAQVRLRAIEEGLPLVRAANTGISAIVDPHGRVTGQVPLGAEAVLDSPLPAALPATPFARFGNAVPLAGTVLALLIGIAARRRA